MNNGKGYQSASLLQEDFLVVNQTAFGFRVYPASDTTHQHIVKEEGEHFTCSCEHFSEEGTCEHIRAVLGTLTDDKRIEQEERKAIQDGGRTPRKKKPTKTAASAMPATMTLKRSVSPDGRIDSLSVEFCCPIDETSNRDISSRAASMLKLQSDIAATFLSNNVANRDGRSNGNGSHPGQDGETGARMLNVGSMQGRYGPRLYIAFEANGQALKLFGTADELADAISGAGYRYGPRQITAGLDLNIPCKVVTKPARDPRYKDIVRILPQDSAASAERC